MDSKTRDAYLARIEAELRQNILPFWIHHTVDRERGGFYGEISNDLKVSRDAERGALLTTRILWTYSSAYLHYPEAPLLEMARWAYDDLMKRFWDLQNGGFYWSASAEGKPLRTRKQIYGQAFGIYALTEYFRAAKDRTALDRAIEVCRAIEKNCRDPKHGGYFEAYTKAWVLEEDVRLSAVDLNEPKSQNTHLHVMEAYTNLLRVWPDAGLRRAQKELVELMLEKILDARTYHLGLFFDEAWRPRTDRVSFGHDIEAAWLLTEAADVVGDSDLQARVRKVAVEIARVTLAEAIDSDGGLLYEADSKGLTQTYKEWWPQAEAAVGFLNAYQISRDEKYLETSLRLWDFIEAHLVDRKHGEWIRSVDRSGKTASTDPKVSFWKCPYHNGRACLELIDRLKKL
ncbi:N-acyl-D-glucosamine 2-epimerase [Opitutaceae bacterium EW11]|nr:N-acyl-D-glucosamine 2-epimerase [Opitutaceae bacterium EW11]